jgi:hypothetical protein
MNSQHNIQSLGFDTKTDENLFITYLKNKFENSFYTIFFMYILQGAQCVSWRNFYAERKIIKHFQKSAKMNDGKG